MSSSLSAYAISFDHLKRVPGSRDRALVEAVGVEFADFLGRIDDLKDEDAEDPIPSCLEAIAQIVDRAPLADHAGYVYGYAVEALCGHLGRELPNVAGISGASDWLNEVDEMLTARGVPLSLSSLVFGECPVEIPRPDDHPFIGSWPPHVIPQALDVMRHVDLSGLDFEMTETFEQILAWLEITARAPENGVVGFLS